MKNLKSILIVLVAMASSIIVKGQVFTEGTNIISAGIGIPNVLKNQFNQIGANAKGSPVVLGSFEHGLNDEWSIGGIVAYSTTSVNDEVLGFKYEGKWKFLIIGAKIDYHFGNEKVDIYGGSVLGYASISETILDKKIATISGFVYYPHLGIRYPFSKNVHGFTEIGYGISILNLGLSISLK